MSQKRQLGALDAIADQSSPVIAQSRNYPAGHKIPWHFHDRDQLVYAYRGVMTVSTADGTWIVPTHRAVWIPAALSHAITMSGAVAMRSLYFRRRMIKSMPRSCCVVSVPPLLRELIAGACEFGALNRANRAQRHLMLMIADQLQAISVEPLRLPTPIDPRAKRVAEILGSNPGERRPFSLLCEEVGASKRTIERLFLRDVGMTWGKWRQQLRLMHAMRYLAEGAKVTDAALQSGYSTPSAFVSMFRRTLGTTPKAYFRDVGNKNY
jgi:AraC-like DNA-binding protein